jgi:stage II sporulation protein D
MPPRVHDYRGFFPKTPMMRVALVLDNPQASIGVAGPFTVRASGSGAELMAGSQLPSCAVQAAGGGMYVGERFLSAKEVRIVPENDGSVSVNGRYYRGQLLVTRAGALTVVNLLDMERYLAAVVGSEVIESWPDNALRAQAVVARTYALNQRKAAVNKVFDVQATVADQVYLGTERETSKLRRIVKETAGIVMWYRGKVFPAYFHSTCAGHTEEVSRVFKYPSIPPLCGVECNYCTSSKYWGWWSTTCDADALAAALRRKGKNVGRISDIEPLDKGTSGRALRVRITSDRGVTEVPAYEFRLLVGASQLRNTSFIVRRSGNTFEFLGRGWGHGVGMCQFGTKGMAEKGYGYLAILKHYYPGVTFARIY